MARDFIVPGHIVTGNNALQEAVSHIVSLGHKACIVSDPVMQELGNIKKLCDVLDGQNILYEIYTGITGEPTDKMIEEGVKHYTDYGCDFLIAIGGGSPIDAMKAIGALIGNRGSINDYLGKPITQKTPPMVAIPTTAGTGSEATQFTIITNTKEDIKMLLKGNVLMPNLAVIDPQFTLSAPKKITAATGLDALCHAVEAYTSRKAQPLSKSFSISAVKRILRYLPEAYQDGSNIEAREQMAIAALEAGIAFNNSSVTLIHGMSRPIGALYHVPHGLSNAMLMKECFTFALDGAYDVFGALAKECGIVSAPTDDKTASEALLKAICNLTEICQIQTPQEFGIEKDNFLQQIPKMAKDAMDSGSPQNTIKACKQEDIEAIYKRLWQ